MLVSLNWLKHYVDYGSLTAEQLGELITKSGIEVDGIDYVSTEKSENVVVGYVVECEKHPNADKLNLCQVDVGDDTLQIICGAPNVAKGQKVAVAKPGAVLPGNFKIKKVKLRGIESNGMICSLKELGVQENYIPEQFAEGIAVLPEDAKIGTSVEELLNLDDAILEFDLTPNRADALSMIGVGYEVAAILDKEITLPNPEIETMEENVAEYVSVSVEEDDLCPYYGAFVVKDVKIEASPLWMQNRLLAAGIRPINNVVDITNYVLLEYGQPLHAFDYDLLGSKEIVVRRAKDGEKMITLDDKTRALTTDNLLITNGKEGIALAGIMGGANTEVNEDTKTVLIEAALFNPSIVRNAVNETGLRSEASTRFEKGIDPYRVREAGLRACELLVKYADGKLVDDAAEFNHLYVEEIEISLNSVEVNRRLGTEISVSAMADIFRKLRFDYTVDGENFTVTIPPRRSDITIFEDMLEEVARIYGYDLLPYTLPANSSKPGGLTKEQQLKRNIKSYLQSVGLFETIQYSLTDSTQVGKFISPPFNQKKLYPVALSWPMSEAHHYLRQSLIPHLLKSLSYNLARKEQNVAMYELGSVFLTHEESISEQPNEHERLAGAVTGMWVDHKWQQSFVRADFYVVKGIVEGLFNYLGIDCQLFPTKLNEMHPGRTAEIAIGEEVVGFIGQVHPHLAKQLDLKETFVFDLDVEKLLQHAKSDLLYLAVPRYPAIKRDLAFVINRNVDANQIKSVIEQVAAPLVKKIEIFDVYEGETLDQEKKSIAFHLHYQHDERTLTDQEVDESIQHIMLEMEQQFDAYVRTE